jgi:hypothetical protein
MKYAQNSRFMTQSPTYVSPPVLFLCRRHRANRKRPLNLDIIDFPS